jgi:transglutaminase-like putative cysteine protease
MAKPLKGGGAKLEGLTRKGWQPVTERRFPMKRSIRFACIFLLVVLTVSACLPCAAAAEPAAIDVSRANDGYFTVNDASGFNGLVKVGVTHNGTTRYYDYANGTLCTYAFESGDGEYTVALYHNVSGDQYVVCQTQDVSVSMGLNMTQYLLSTTEVTFSKTDAVGQKAAELCKGCDTDEEKVIAFYKFISANYRFNRTLANQINAHIVTYYMPNNAALLQSHVGICYDLSCLFAGFCRSQDIPCTLTKGYCGKTYHAWNKVYVNGKWYPIDMTYALGRSLKKVNSIEKCMSRITTYTRENDNIATVKPA